MYDSEDEAENQGRREGDKQDNPIVVSYRLGMLEKAFVDFDGKLDEALFNKGQIQLIDYRLLQLEKWRNRLVAAFITVATGLIIVLITQVVVFASQAGAVK